MSANVEAGEQHRWKYRVVYENGAGAMDLYFTDSRADASRVAAERRGHIEGPLGDGYWGKAAWLP